MNKSSPNIIKRKSNFNSKKASIAQNEDLIEHQSPQKVEVKKQQSSHKRVPHYQHPYLNDGTHQEVHNMF